MSQKQNKQQQSAPPFDPDALREKYRQERDKRIRVEGNKQFVETTGKFAHFGADPNAAPDFSREPLTDEVELLIVGGGFGGLLAAARLRKAGIKDIRIIEKGADFGGTWYWNRYPGAQCDIESYIYLPLLEELGYVPKEKYSYAGEILAHTQAIGQHYDLYAKACFQTQVTELRWDDAAKHWLVATDRGDLMRARYVCLCPGPLNKPKLPGIEGIESFKGHTFHTSRWDYGYTGGDSSGKLMTGLENKRVGIIGTGATAVQCTPHVGKAAKQLYVFQRTPSSVDARNNRPTDVDWFKTQQPGWQQRRMANFALIQNGVPQDEDLVDDGWTDLARILGAMVSDTANPEAMDELAELADFQKMEQIRARMESIIADPTTAEALKPYYRQGCKRPCFHDDYLETFNRPTVSLVDTQGRGVERITESTVVVDGQSYEVDCLIFATGFEVATAFTQRAGLKIFGRNSLSLDDKWRDGLRTLHGLQTADFPNCFFMGVTQGSFTANLPHTLKEQTEHIAYIVEHALKNNTPCIEVTTAAEDEWVATMGSMVNNDYLLECTPGYYNNEGRPGEGQDLVSSQYGGGPMAFFQVLQDWRDEGNRRGQTYS